MTKASFAIGKKSNYVTKLPFGEEVAANVGGRSGIQGYNGDNTRQKFTTYERDKESGLDYAQARYHNSNFGRFTSPDPLLASGKPTVPQSWNRYSYCLNNPLALVDPTGLIWAQKSGERHVKWFDSAEEMAKAGYTAITTFFYEVGGTWYSLNPNAKEWKSFVTEDAAKWQYFKYTNFGGWGSFPIANGVLNYLGNVKTGNFAGALGSFFATAADVATLPSAAKSLAASGLKEVGEEVAESGAAALADDAAKAGNVLLDSSVIAGLRKDPTLGGRVLSGESSLVSYVTRPELRNAVSTGNLKGVPGALNDLPVLGTRPSLNLRINIRGALPSGRGNFGDGVIGAQAVQYRLPLVTNDRALGNAVRAFGGTVR